jgi:hypothetical protein
LTAGVSISNPAADKNGAPGRSRHLTVEVKQVGFIRKLPAKLALSDSELRLEAEMAERIREYPVELRVLNQAPLSFRYQVIEEGILLVIRDETFVASLWNRP